ncbi:hypothetical protein LB553_02375 [Mesorhizobium sp. CA8]|uniref:DUF6894 family protein n=1 Tax=unclassified Mesorhizobium TaxID=325217 RepID=UPI001CCC13CD|nr:hypothetical protein [Mesorhizobium sp. CA8]MBZ9759731.1 hypothetical protein [Mesorhizobium sp. CA8]
MPRYVFEVTRNGQRFADAWVELDSLRDMRREALKALHDIAVDEMAESDIDETLAISVHDETGRAIYSATLTISQSLPLLHLFGR